MKACLRIVIAFALARCGPPAPPTSVQGLVETGDDGATWWRFDEVVVEHGAVEPGPDVYVDPHTDDGQDAATVDAVDLGDGHVLLVVQGQAPWYHHGRLYLELCTDCEPIGVAAVGSFTAIDVSPMPGAGWASDVAGTITLEDDEQGARVAFDLTYAHDDLDVVSRGEIRGAVSVPALVPLADAPRRLTASYVAARAER